MKTLLFFLSWFLAGTAVAQDAAIESRSDLRTYTFELPAPRGLIVDRFGEPLAQSRWVHALALRLAAAPDASSGPEALEKLQPQIDSLPADLRDRIQFSTADLQKHWEHRRWIPFPISSASSEIRPEVLENGTAITTIPEIQRYYPHDETAAHILGYLSRDIPRQYGDPIEGEPLWPLMQGSSGLEKVYEDALAGTPGLIQMIYAKSGALVSRQVLREAISGETVVTTLMLDLQKLAEKKLVAGERAGGITMIDAISGDIVAIASYPTFDPNAFIPSISATAFQSLKEDPDRPFFPRAWAASYPPGSVFKPLVAIAGLDRGTIRGLGTRFEGTPTLEIDGRVFHNWSDRNEGMLDVRGALMRSSNTWFYRAGILTGGENILSTAVEYGVGQSIRLPLDQLSAGNLPVSSPPTRQGVANLSIGQGTVETSSLQMANAMATIANGRYRPTPRLVLQRQTAPIESEPSQVVEKVERTRENLLSTRANSLNYVREGMWLVVNHERGTGKAAQVASPEVRGKTGTAQWSRSGEERNLAWFSGYVDAHQPQLAFTVMIEGRSGERLYGGSGAAPIVGEILRTAYGAAENYHLTMPPVRARPVQRPTLTQTAPVDSTTQTGSENPVPTSEEVMEAARRIKPIDSTVILERLNAQEPAQQNKRGLLDRIGGLFD